MKQHRKPCSECPFGKQAKVKTLGGSEPEVYIGQILGPFWLPCHEDPKYKGKQSNPNKVAQCVGASIFRANLGLNRIMPKALDICEADPELSFTSFEEFAKHHTGKNVEYSPEDLTNLLQEQVGDRNARIIQSVFKEKQDVEETPKLDQKDLE